MEVAQRLAKRGLPDAVRVADFGIRGFDLAFALLDGYEAVILVDAAPRGQQPGTLYVLEPDPPAAAPIDDPAATEAGSDPEAAGPMIDMHGMDPVKVLRLADTLGEPGERVSRILLVGCEPHPLTAEEEMDMEISEPVRTAVDEAIPLVESLVAELLDQRPAVRGQGPEQNVAPAPDPAPLNPTLSSEP